MHAQLEPLLTVSRAGAKAEGRFFLRNIDLHLAPGETVAVCGPAGAGKSALVDLLFGHAPLSEGCIRFDGRALDPPFPFTSLRSGMALVPQRLCNLPLRTVEQNIRVGDVGTPGDWTLPRIVKLLPSLGPLLSSACWRLSLAQQREAALARALIGNPSLVLFDAASDAGWGTLSSSIVFALRTIAQRGTAVLLTTRHSAVAARLADRVVWLHEGRLATPNAALARRAASPTSLAMRAGGAETSPHSALAGNRESRLDR